MRSQVPCLLSWIPLFKVVPHHSLLVPSSTPPKILEMSDLFSACAVAMFKPFDNVSKLINPDSPPCATYKDSSVIKIEKIDVEEAHCLKSKTAQVCRAAKTMKTKVKIAMTGTPMQNNLDELWHFCDNLGIDNFGDHKTFKNYYINVW